MRVRDIKPGDQFEDQIGNVWLKTRERGSLTGSILCVLVVKKATGNVWPQLGSTSNKDPSDDAYPVGYRA